MEKESWLKLGLIHWDFASRLVKLLWLYVCKYYDEEVKIPKTMVVFISAKMFKKFIKSVDTSKSIQKEYGRQSNVRSSVMLYLGSAHLEEGETCHLIAIRKSRLLMTRRFLIKHFHQDFSLPETLLIPLIHETIHIYEEMTGRTCLNHSKEPVTEPEKVIFMWFKKDHPEYFSKESEKNMSKYLSKIPNH